MRGTLSLLGWATSLCVAVAGCVTAARYPAEWAPVPAGPSACAEVSGVYYNVGTRYGVEDLFGTQGSARDAALASLLFNTPERTLSNPRAPSRLRIDAASTGRLGVAAIFDDGREIAVTLLAEKEEFVCNEGKIELRSGNFDVLPIAIAFAGGKTTHTLSRAADGSLIVESRQWAVGTALIWIPIGFNDRAWSRFAAAGDGAAVSK